MREGRARWRSRFGLQARMAASYVLVTAAVVTLLEVVAIGFIIPSLLATQDLTNRVNQTAATISEELSIASTSTDRLTLPANFVLGQLNTLLGPGQMQVSGNGVLVPQLTASFPSNAAPLTFALVFTPDGRIVASSYPARYPVGSSAYAVIPYGAGYSSGKAGQISPTATGRVAWAVQPVVLLQISSNSKSSLPGADKTFPPAALVYVQAPIQAANIASVNSAAPLLQAGLVLLLFTLPVGVIFGVLTTRSIVRRLRRLGATTAKLAEGDLSQRVTAGSADEVGQLERDFNEMAERLQAAVSHERALADKTARLAERSRISRELHDSISQDLFSLSLLAAGLDKALPDDSPVRGEVRALAETVESANREMRALLLELRPTTLEEKGLVPALEELVSTYATRLGIKVDADLHAVRLAPAVELAALRIAQEGIANAVKHAHSKTIRLSLTAIDGAAEITVADDGGGFDASTNGSHPGLGLRLMRERVDELGGSLTVDSEAGRGTMITATLPAQRASR